MAFEYNFDDRPVSENMYQVAQLNRISGKKQTATLYNTHQTLAWRRQLIVKDNLYTRG